MFEMFPIYISYLRTNLSNYVQKPLSKKEKKRKGKKRNYVQNISISSLYSSWPRFSMILWFMIKMP